MFSCEFGKVFKYSTASERSEKMWLKKELQ